MPMIEKITSNIYLVLIITHISKFFRDVGKKVILI